jgi:hypothetical protein
MSKTDYLTLLERHLFGDFLAKNSLYEVPGLPDLSEEEWEKLSGDLARKAKEYVNQLREKSRQRKLEFEERLRRIDLELAGVQGVKRVSNKLLIEGAFARYEIDIPTNEVKGVCKENHTQRSRSICLHLGEGGNVDQATGLALNLLHDDELKNKKLLEKIEDLCFCPDCIIEEAKKGVSNEFIERIRKFSQRKEELAKNSAPERGRGIRSEEMLLRREREELSHELRYLLSERADLDERLLSGGTQRQIVEIKCRIREIEERIARLRGRT